MANESTIYLIPSVLSNDNTAVIPPEVPHAIARCSMVYAENIRTARRFFKMVYPEVVIDDITWIAIEKAEHSLVAGLAASVRQHAHIGIVSEAGCPAIADPGYLLVAAAHKLPHVTIKPLSGPSSMMMALMASGLGGQKFAFHGYLPIESAGRKAAIQHIWKRAEEDEASQIFMETPYRNNALFADLLQHLPAQAALCLAVNISSPQSFIATRHIGEWKKMAAPDLHKKPCIFVVGARF